MPVVTDHQEVPNTPAALAKPIHITATVEYKGNRFPEHGSLAWKVLQSGVQVDGCHTLSC